MTESIELNELTKLEINKGYVYFAYYPESNDKHIKIGITTNLKKRLIQLQTGSPSLLRFYKTIYSSNYKKIEKDLHKKYKDKNVLNEWFDISLEEIDEIVLSYQNEIEIEIKIEETEESIKEKYDKLKLKHKKLKEKYVKLKYFEIFNLYEIIKQKDEIIKQREQERIENKCNENINLLFLLHMKELQSKQETKINNIISGLDLYNLYVKWCNENNKDFESNTKFGKNIKPYIKKYISGGIKYHLDKIII